MKDRSKFVSKSQVQQLVRLLPTPRQKRFGRKRVTKESLVTGIVQVVVMGIAWRDIHDVGCSYVSCYRHFYIAENRTFLLGIDRKNYHTPTLRTRYKTQSSLDGGRWKN